MQEGGLPVCRISQSYAYSIDQREKGVEDRRNQRAQR